MNANRLLKLLEEADFELWSPDNTVPKGSNIMMGNEEVKHFEHSYATNPVTIKNHMDSHLIASYYPHVSVESSSYSKKGLKIKFMDERAGSSCTYTFSVDSATMRSYVEGEGRKLDITKWYVPHSLDENGDRFPSFQKLDWIEPVLLSSLFGTPAQNWPSKVGPQGYGPNSSRTYDAYGNVKTRER